MTGALRPRASRPPGHRVLAAAVSRRVGGRSRDRGRVSQARDGCRQIQSHLTEGAVYRGMIGQVHDPPDHPRTDRSSDPRAYTSAYRSAYSDVYNQPKEVS